MKTIDEFARIIILKRMYNKNNKNCWPQKNGGMERIVHYLVEELARRGHQV